MGGKLVGVTSAEILLLILFTPFFRFFAFLGEGDLSCTSVAPGTSSISG
jgi:hypothetical protein